MNKLFIVPAIAPCKLKSDTKLTLYKIILSYGGGMGGSSARLYVKSKSERNPEGWVDVQYLSGHKREINSRYIVSTELVKVVHVEWEDLRGGFATIVDEYFLLEYDQEYEVTADQDSTKTSNLRYPIEKAKIKIEAG